MNTPATRHDDVPGGSGAQVPQPAAASTQDALALLHDDHRHIEALLADCRMLAASEAPAAADASGLVSRLGALLIAHAQMEQQLFYPAVGLTATQMAEVVAEHQAIEAHLHALSHPEFDAAVFREQLDQLSTAVRGHLHQEEAQIFERARTSGVDLLALGTQLALRRGELLGPQGVD